MKAVVAAFKQEKALVGAIFVITNLRKDLRFKLQCRVPGRGKFGQEGVSDVRCAPLTGVKVPGDAMLLLPIVTGMPPPPRQPQCPR